MSIVRSIIRSPIRSAIRSVLGASAGSLYGNDMVLVMATTTPDETVTIPCQNVGIFDASIDWGDGSTSAITAYNDADLAHVYADADDHIIRISETFPNIFFNNGGDRLKLKKVLQLGSTGLTRLDSAFRGCSNMTEFLGGVVDTSAVTNMGFMFYSCSSLTTLDVSGFNTSAVTNMRYMFNSCSSLTTLDVSGFNTSAVTNMGFMFYSCSSLTTLDVSGFNTSAVTNMRYMFNSCSSLLDAAIDGWNIEAVANFADFMTGVTLPTARYDATLIAWDAQNPIDGLSVNFGGSKYTLGSPAATARANLVSTDSWVLTDGGSV